MVRRLRTGSGIVLFTYLLTHYTNHALGLISLDAMEAGREWFVVLWRNPLGTIVLYGALLTHLTLVLWTLFQRRSLHMPGWQTGQIILGLMIPPLLAEHIIGTRLLAEIYGIGDTYTYVVLVLWEFAPEKGLQQARLSIQELDNPIYYDWHYDILAMYFLAASEILNAKDYDQAVDKLRAGLEARGFNSAAWDFSDMDGVIKTAELDKERSDILTAITEEMKSAE